MWNDVGMSAGGGGHLKLENGESVKIHILGEAEGAPAEPKSYFSYFNQAVQRGVTLPEGFKDSSIKITAKHSLLVWSFKDEAVRIWSMGNTVATQIKGIYDAYDGDLSGVDIVLKRIGADKTTKYVPTAKPTEFDATVLDGVEIPNLDEIFAPNTEEEIENLKNGIAPERGEVAEAAAAPADDATTPDDAPGDSVPDDDEEAKAAANLAAIKARKAQAALAAKAKAGTNVGKAATKPAAAAPADQRMALVKKITHLFATNAKFKTPAARANAIKAVAKGKTTLSQLSVAELTTLSGKVK